MKLQQVHRAKGCGPLPTALEVRLIVKPISLPSDLSDRSQGFSLSIPWSVWGP